MKAATKTNLKLVSLVLGMFCFGFALVPIYDVFCEITGLNGKVSGPTITEYDDNFNSELKLSSYSVMVGPDTFPFKPVISQNTS